MKYVIVDISGMLYRTFFAYRGESPDTSAGMAAHMAFTSLMKVYKKFRPDKVVIASDSSSWRKKYTKSSRCLSGKLYKGNRRQNMTPGEQRKFQQFIEHIQEFESILYDNTSMICLKSDELEADDLIAGFVEAHIDDEIIIVSRDRDLTQLIGEGKEISNNIIQWDPQAEKYITIETAICDLLKEKPNTIPNQYLNVDFFLFAKQLRGDTGDNVQAAYPGIRKKKIYEAYDDPYIHSNIMNHIWTNEHQQKFKVEGLFEEGALLMDLRKQPNHIRNKMFKTILYEIDNPKTFNYFKFIKYCGKRDLKRVSESADKYVEVLAS